MRRRLATVLTAALLGSALLLPAAAAASPDGATSSGLVATSTDGGVPLAASGPVSDEGLDPMEPDATENEFAPSQYEANVTWRANNYIFFLVMLVTGGMALLYWLKVGRHSRESRQS